MDIAKQVITLSTGSVAFIVTFFEKFINKQGVGINHAPPLSLCITWGCSCLAILLSLWTLMAITGTLEALDRTENGWTLSAAQDAVAKDRVTPTSS